MKTIALIACSGRKLPEAKEYPDRMFKAQDIYTGVTFKLARNIGVQKFHCDDFYIISAKHHLLDKNEEICYYNVQLKSSVINHENGKRLESNKNWAKKVLEQLAEKGYDLEKDKFVIFGGRNYYKNLASHLNCCVFNFNGKRFLKEDDLEQQNWKYNGGK